MKKIILPVTTLALVLAFAAVLYYQKPSGGYTKKLDFLVEEKTVAELSKESRKVVIATVESVLPSEMTTEKLNDSEMIYTDIVLSVQETLKDKHVDKVIVRLPGGTIGEGEQKRSVLVEDTPELKVGEKVLFFLGKGTDGLFQLPGENYYSVYGGFQGVYKIQDNQALNPKATLEADKLVNEVRESIR